MNKAILQEYIDACEQIKETEKKLEKLKRKKKVIIKDGVSGSNPEFPYQPMQMHISGIAYTYKDEDKVRSMEIVLEERKRRAEEIKIQVEEWMNTLTIRMQRIVEYRFIEGLSWGEVAAKIGRRATKESVRKEFENFFSKK